MVGLGALPSPVAHSGGPKRAATSCGKHYGHSAFYPEQTRLVNAAQRMTNPRCGAFLISEGGFSPLVAADVTSSHDFDLVRGYLSASSRPNCGFPRRGAHNGSTRSSGTEMGDGIVKRRASCSIAASCSPTRRYVSAKFVGCRRSHGSGHQFSPRVDRQCAGAGPERAERLVDGPPRATRGEWQPLEQSHVSISESHHTLATLSFATQAPLRAAWPRT